MRKILGPVQSPKPEGHEALYCSKPIFFDYLTNYYPIDPEFDSHLSDCASHYVDRKLLNYVTSRLIEDEPVDLENLESPSPGYADNDTPLEQAKENEFDGNSSADHSDNAQDACYLIHPENLAMVLLEEVQPVEHSINLSEAITRPEQIEQFGSYITKELHLLNDDLLEEAKARIYDIICIMHMKQVQQNQADN